MHFHDLLKFKENSVSCNPITKLNDFPTDLLTENDFQIKCQIKF